MKPAPSGFSHGKWGSVPVSCCLWGGAMAEPWCSLHPREARSLLSACGCSCGAGWEELGHPLHCLCAVGGGE